MKIEIFLEYFVNDQGEKKPDKINFPIIDY